MGCEGVREQGLDLTRGPSALARLYVPQPHPSPTSYLKLQQVSSKIDTDTHKSPASSPVTDARRLDGEGHVRVRVDPSVAGRPGARGVNPSLGDSAHFVPSSRQSLPEAARTTSNVRVPGGTPQE